jgi:uncharacterized protein (TIGR02145 family)
MEPEFSTFTDPRDGHTYRTVKIGNQEWFAENFDYDCPGSVVYEDKTENETRYGRLYTWAELMGFDGKMNDNVAFNTDEERGATYRGIAPEGWHIPSDAEWKELKAYVDSIADTEFGTALKSRKGWKKDPDGCPTGADEVGFNALPSGRHMPNGEYLYGGKGAHFWTSTEVDKVYAIRWGGTYAGEEFTGFRTYKAQALALRLVKDR